MRIRPVSTAVAIASALLVAVSPMAGAAPATGTWTGLGPGTPVTLMPGNVVNVYGIEVGPDGRTYMYGPFVDAGGDPTADYLAVYNPSTNGWSGLGGNGTGNGALSGPVYDVEWVNGTLYAGGAFSNAGGDPTADFLAGWNGSVWTGRGGSGVTAALGNIVTALDERNGLLYLAGMFTNAANIVTADYLATWDGYAYHGVGSDGGGNGAIKNIVTCMQVTADGRIYLGGYFTGLGGVLGGLVAYWDPATLSYRALAAPGSLSAPVIGTSVRDLLIVGTKVYIAGDFTDVAGIDAADGIAVWSGSAWGALGSTAPLDGVPEDLAAYGSNVIVGGWFSNAAGIAAADRVAVWNGTKWMAVGTGDLGGAVFGVDVAGRTLRITGTFGSVGGAANTLGVAAYGLPAAPSAPRSLVGSSGSRRVSLTWAAPSTANGATIRDYVIQYRRSGTSTWKTFAHPVRTTRTAVVTGLSSGVTYQFRVLAKNDWGTGAGSSVISKRAG